MRKILPIFLLLSPLALLGQVPYNDLNWNATPIFNEDFSDSLYWGKDRLDNSHTWRAYFSECGVTHGSHEHQIYQRENALFNTPAPGYMTLRAEYKPNTTKYWYPRGYSNQIGSWDYISGTIETLKNFQFGYFEMRCTMPPPSNGNFPAFWLWGGTDNGRYNEIDIFEHVVENGPSMGNTFTGGYYTSVGKGRNRVTYTTTESDSALTNFHTYSIEWSPKVLIWYFDGKQVGAALNEPEITDKSMPLKINYALNDYVKTANKRLFPLDMVIDYVKVYELNCDCNDSIVITNNTELESYSHSVKKRIEIGNSTNNITVPEKGLTLRATDEITINGTFEVPLGTEFYATTHACPKQDKTTNK